MQKWEYKILTTREPSEQSFNELGAQGWELIVASYDGSYGASYVFKRPKTEAATLPPIRT